MLKPQNILVVKNRALGDSVMGLASVQYLRDLYPKANIIYAVPQWVAPLYKETKTAADQIYPLSLKSLKEVFQTYRDLKESKIDHIHEMHQSGRGAKFFKFIAFFLGIPYTAHNHHLKTPGKVIDQGIIKSLIQRDLDGVYSFLGSGEVPKFLNYSPAFHFLKNIKKNPTIIFGVVATRKTKMWSLENFIKLAGLIQKNHPAFKVVIPLSKSETDQVIKSKLIALGLPENTSIVEWSLSELPAEFGSAIFYFGNDTGLKHIAVASGIKTFTVFGPEPASEWHPYDEKKHQYFYLEGLPCRTRTHHYCGLAICDLTVDHMKCMEFFTPEKIMEALHSTCKDFLQSGDQ